jgi:hypothetical protein
MKQGAAYFALNPSGHLVFATAELMAYCKSAAPLCGYPSGTLQIIDLIICMSEQPQSNAWLAMLLNRKMGETAGEIPLDTSFVFLWKYLNPDVVPVLKTWVSKPQLSKNMLLDTIFDGQRVRIAAHQARARFCINVEGQTFDLTLSEAHPEALVAYHAHGLRYCSAPLQDAVRSERLLSSENVADVDHRMDICSPAGISDAESVLDGNPFAGCIDRDRLYALKAADIFHEALLQALDRLDAPVFSGAADQCMAVGDLPIDQLDALLCNELARSTIFLMEERALFLRKLSDWRSADFRLYQVGEENHLRAMLNDACH